MIHLTGDYRYLLQKASGMTWHFTRYNDPLADLARTGLEEIEAKQDDGACGPPVSVRPFHAFSLTNRSRADLSTARFIIDGVVIKCFRDSMGTIFPDAENVFNSSVQLELCARVLIQS